MNKEFIYRNIAMIGGLLLLANVIFINHQENLVTLSKVVDFIIVPITVISASFWYRRNLVLLGVLFYFISYAYDLLVEFEAISTSNIFSQYNSQFVILGSIGLLLIIVSGIEKLNRMNNWFSRKIKQPESIVSIVAVSSFLLTLFALLFFD